MSHVTVGSSTICPYCGEESVLVTGKTVYPHRRDLQGKYFWLCAPCEAWVGCHPGTTNPMGRLADSELRKAKSEAHDSFDTLWHKKGMTRKQAYSCLANSLGIPAHLCHIGLFDVATCKKVVSICTPHKLSHHKSSPESLF
jgi:hypothetical protein